MRTRVDRRYRTVHFGARIVDIDRIQIVPRKLPRLNIIDRSELAFCRPVFTNFPDGTKTKEEYAAHLCEVHQSCDTGLIPVQSRERLLPFRQDLIPPAFAGHIGGRLGPSRGGGRD